MKKALSFIIIGILLGGTIAFASTKTFFDVAENSWYEQAVENLAERDVIQGYPDGTFKPGNSVNRAELAVILNRFADKVVDKDLDERKTCYDPGRVGVNVMIYDQNGQRLSGATGRLISQKYGELPITEDSVFEGNYYAYNMPAKARGYFILGISKPGYREYTETVKIELDDCGDQIILQRTIILPGV